MRQDGRGPAVVLDDACAVLEFAIRHVDGQFNGVHHVDRNKLALIDARERAEPTSNLPNATRTAQGVLDAFQNVVQQSWIQYFEGTSHILFPLLQLDAVVELKLEVSD